MEIESEAVWCFQIWTELVVSSKLGSWIQVPENIEFTFHSRPRHIPLDNPKDKHYRGLAGDFAEMVPDMCGMQDRQWRTSCYDPGLWIYASCRRTSSSKDGNSANQRLFERQICTVFASVTQAAFEGLIPRYPMNIDHSSFSFKFSGTFQHFWATSCHHFVREFDNFIYRCLRFIYFPSLHEGASASSSTLLVCPVLARREKWESGFPGFPWLTLLRS